MYSVNCYGPHWQVNYISSSMESKIESTPPVRIYHCSWHFLCVNYLLDELTIVVLIEKRVVSMNTLCFNISISIGMYLSILVSRNKILL